MGVRIYDSNFSDLATITSDSEQTAFPLTNAFNAQRRTRVWRSNGHYEVTSSNNTLFFDESSTQYEATIATGSYSSRTALLAAVKTAMEAVGPSTYDWTVDSTTSKFKLTASPNPVTLEWLSAASTCDDLLGFDDTFETSSTTHLADKLVIHTSETITWDFGISTLPKAFVLIGARNSPIKISPSATLKLYGNETDIWTAPSETITLDYNDEVIYSVSTTGLWSEALRYAQLELIDQDNPNAYVEIGNLYLGDLFAPTRGRSQFPFAGQYVDRSITSFSEGGQSFSDIREKTEVFTINWFGLTVSEKDSIDGIWDDFGKSIPFFVQFDPDASFFASINSGIRYVKFQSEPRYSLVSPGNYSCSMVLREEL